MDFAPFLLSAVHNVLRMRKPVVCDKLSVHFMTRIIVKIDFLTLNARLAVLLSLLSYPEWVDGRCFSIILYAVNALL